MLEAPKNVPPGELPAALEQYARALIKEQFEYLLEATARVCGLDCTGTDDDTPEHELPKIVTEEPDESFDHHVAKLRLKGHKRYSYEGRLMMEALIEKAMKGGSDNTWDENYAQGKIYIAGELLKMLGHEGEGSTACAWGTWGPCD